MRGRQFIHVVDFAVRSAPPVKRYPVPRRDPLFGIGSQSRIRRRSRTPALRSPRRNRSRRFCRRLAGTLRFSWRFRTVTSVRSANLRWLGAICNGPARTAPAKKTNPNRANREMRWEITETPRQFQKRKGGAAFKLRSDDAVASTGHDCGVGGGGFRRGARRAPPALACL